MQLRANILLHLCNGRSPFDSIDGRNGRFSSEGRNRRFSSEGRNRYLYVKLSNNLTNYIHLNYPVFNATGPAVNSGGGARSDDDDGEEDDENDEEEEIQEDPVIPAGPQIIEKIPDEDRRKPHVVKRTLFKILPFLEKGTRVHVALI